MHVRLHYLRRRASTMLSQHVIGDELDMLGLYLDTSLNFVGLPPRRTANSPKRLLCALGPVLHR